MRTNVCAGALDLADDEGMTYTPIVPRAQAQGRYMPWASHISMGSWRINLKVRWPGWCWGCAEEACPPEASELLATPCDGQHAPALLRPSPAWPTGQLVAQGCRQPHKAALWRGSCG